MRVSSVITLALAGAVAARPVPQGSLLLDPFGLTALIDPFGLLNTLSGGWVGSNNGKSDKGLGGLGNLSLSSWLRKH